VGKPVTELQLNPEKNNIKTLLWNDKLLKKENKNRRNDKFILHRNTTLHFSFPASCVSGHWIFMRKFLVSKCAAWCHCRLVVVVVIVAVVEVGR
jgi:hypothetical protein